jgi:hypothetical protein
VRSSESRLTTMASSGLDLLWSGATCSQGSRDIRCYSNNDQIAALRLFAAAEASMEFNDGLDHLVLATQTGFVR